VVATTSSVKAFLVNYKTDQSGTLISREWKTREWKTRHHNAGVENAGVEIAEKGNYGKRTF